ncbi:MAG: hypothetical protein IPK16_31760 [Anaerolineales bacterium]|nr:hypothetical protein [Anaerolineales bacterium]
MDRQTQRATEMIRQILDFSRRFVFERTTLDLLPLVKEQIKLLARTLPENIAIEFTHDAGPFMVKADPTRMAQVIMNLSINARDAMPDGGKLLVDVAQVATPAPEVGSYRRWSLIIGCA